MKNDVHSAEGCNKCVLLAWAETSSIFLPTCGGATLWISVLLIYELALMFRHFAPHISATNVRYLYTGWHTLVSLFWRKLTWAQVVVRISKFHVVTSFWQKAHFLHARMRLRTMWFLRAKSQDMRFCLASVDPKASCVNLAEVKNENRHILGAFATNYTTGAQ